MIPETCVMHTGEYCSVVKGTGTGAKLSGFTTKMCNFSIVSRDA